MTSVTLYADITCPFAYVASCVVAPALRRRGVSVHWRPWELAPELPPSGTALPERDAGRIWGSARRIAERHHLEIRRKAPHVTPNTRPFLAATAWLAHHAPDALDSLVPELYAGWFARGEDLADLAARALDAAPLPPADALTLDEALAAIRTTATEAGVRSAPAFLLPHGVLHGLLDAEDILDELV